MATVIRLCHSLLLGALAAQTPGTAPPAGGTAGSGQIVHEVVLDLAEVEPGFVRLAVPEAGRFKLFLENRAPGASYRLRYVMSNQEHGQIFDGIRLWIPPQEPPCDEITQRRREFQAIRDETEIPAAVEDIRPLLSRSDCPQLLDGLRFEIGSVRTEIFTHWIDDPTQSWLLEIDRLADGTELAERSWRVEVDIATPVRSWAWASELQWLVGEPARDILEAIWVAAGRELPPDRLPVQVAGAVPDDVAVRFGDGAPLAKLGEDAIWRPEAYSELVGSALESWGVRPAEAGPAGGALEALTAPTTATIAAQSRIVSRRLRSDPGDPTAHEEAGLVLVALALREASGDLYDTRALLNRITAHLGLAGGIRAAPGAPPSPAGPLARVALLALARRQTEAISALEALEREDGPIPAAEMAWRRALRIYITGDWRVLQDPARVTLLERLQHFRALLVHRGLHSALDWLAESGAEPMPDWGRHILNFNHADVGAGNMLSPTAIPAEISDAGQVLLPDAVDVSHEAVASALREGSRVGRWETPRPALSHAITPELWVAFFERHIVAAVESVDRHLNYSLGLPERASKHRVDSLRSFGELPRFLAVASRWSSDRRVTWRKEWDFRAACRRGAELSFGDPDRLGIQDWAAVRSCVPEFKSGLLQPMSDWYQVTQLPGTAYDLWRRDGAAEGLLPADYAKAHVLAPWDRASIWGHAQELHGSIEAMTRVQIENVYGPLLEYDMLAMADRAAAAKDEPDDYVRFQGELCQFEADYCISLANHLVDLARDEEAAVAYQRAWNHGRDRVLAANRVRWLMRHYYEEGRLQEALAVAEGAARVYSRGGLLTKAQLFERLGRYDEAAEIYEQIVERYDIREDADIFYVAYEQRVGDGRFEAKAEEALPRLFPQGLQRVSLAELREPPQAGVVIRSTTRRLEQLGLAEGDVIVGLDGYRVGNRNQYLCVRDFSFQGPIRVLAFHDGSYVERSGAFPQRSFDATLRDYEER